MPKAIVRIVCGTLIMLVTVAGISACAQRPEPEYADQIAESLLLAINEDDYAKYSEHFDEVMKNAMPKAAFKQTNSLIKAKIGDYISKEFWKVKVDDPYTTVLYKAKFTREPKDVVVRVVFLEIAGKIYLSGLWFDSPKLRQQ